MKQFRGYVVIASVIVVVYALVALGFDREVVRQHERNFIEQQALQIELSARSIEDHFSWLLRETQLAARHFVPQYLASDAQTNIPDNMISALAQGPESDGLAVGFFVSPAVHDMLYLRTDEQGAQAGRLLVGWVRSYWVSVRDSRAYFVTPFDVFASRACYGLLIPVFHEGEFVGILGAVFDFVPLLERYVIPVRSGVHGSAWVQDAESRVIYDHETDVIGLHVSEIAQSHPDMRNFNRRLMTEDRGQGEYHYPQDQGGPTVRKLAAWSTAMLGNQRLTVALSAPDAEVSAELALSREQATALGVLLLIVLAVSAGLYYYLLQRTLQKEVRARTSELEALTAELEQRVARRTTQLEQERAQLHTVLEAMDEGVVYRQGEQVLYANAALTRLLGYSKEEILSGPGDILRLVTGKAGAEDPLRSVRGDAQSGVERREVRLVRKDGTPLDASIYVASVRDRQNQPLGMVEIIRDVTPQKTLQAQRDRFITNAAHELRRPLSNLKTRIYLLGRQPDKMLEHVEIIQKATDDMADLVQDLVDMAQLAGDELSLNRRPLVLQHVVQSALDIQQGHAYRVRVQIKTDLPDEPLYALADYQRLTQTFNNLLAHAIHATAPDGQVDVHLYQQMNHALLDIENDGPTLDPTHLMYIFEPFFQPSEGSAQRTGMGLALARQIIEKHDGHIVAFSDPDTNRFRVRIPLRSDPS